MHVVSPAQFRQVGIGFCGVPQHIKGLLRDDRTCMVRIAAVCLLDATDAIGRIISNDPIAHRQEGNRRFVNGCPLGSKTKAAARQQLVEDGQAPHTAIIGCADSRAPLESIFDTMPGARKGAGKMTGIWEQVLE